MDIDAIASGAALHLVSALIAELSERDPDLRDRIESRLRSEQKAASASKSRIIDEALAEIMA